MKEHYGITVPTSSVRIITQHHAHRMFEQEDRTAENTSASAMAQSLILAETDGSMIPIVKTKPKPEGVDKYDARKYKEHYWREARLSFARPIGSVTPTFAATLGGVESVGKQLLSCAQQVGFTEQTKVHCLGDGAPWIANQVDEQFGSQATYLVDLYHVCDYLAEAAPKCSNNNREWIAIQKENLKAGGLLKVLLALQPHLESPDEKDSEAPVRRCYRYLDNRRDQLDYPSAIAQGLPIGSGEIESAHRYVIQKRLKITGAWWKEENAADMLALRINRANRNWDGYWKSRKAA